MTELEKTVIKKARLYVKCLEDSSSSEKSYKIKLYRAGRLVRAVLALNARPMASNTKFRVYKRRF